MNKADYGVCLAVDWSAAAVPRIGRDSIWIARARTDRTGGAEEAWNPSTRHEAMSLIRDLAAEAVRVGQSVLIGFDFPLGYPAGLAGALGHADWRGIWRELADLIDDGPDNANNRFTVAAALNRRLGTDPGPFWGRPASRDLPDLPAKRPVWSDGWRFRQLRHSDDTERIKKNGLRGHPHPVWKLYTTGSVGSQALMGIARLATWRFATSRRIDALAPLYVWPFDTGFSAGPGEPHALAVEMYPSLWAARSFGLTPKDRDQVAVAAHMLAAACRGGDIDRWLAGPQDLPAHTRNALIEQEAWMIGLL